MASVLPSPARLLTLLNVVEELEVVEVVEVEMSTSRPGKCLVRLRCAVRNI